MWRWTCVCPEIDSVLGRPLINPRNRLANAFSSSDGPVIGMCMHTTSWRSTGTVRR